MAIPITEIFTSLTQDCEIPSNKTSLEICNYFKNDCQSLRYFYIKYYYCLNNNNPVGSNLFLWTFVSITICMLFLILGLLASDYLVPNLTSLSDLLNLDEKLAGLTLLAFANGSPDILSTYLAMKKNLTTMAIGELLGSANFSLTVVIGVLAIYEPFEVNHKTFKKDLILFSVFLIISLYILFDGTITLFESIILCCLYIAFICLNVFLPETFHEKIKQEQQLLNNNEQFIIMNNTNNNSISSTNSETTSVNSVSSVQSLNDFYFAQNLDNFEQGRSYKFALIDSIKLIWFWRKRAKEISQSRLQSITELTPLDSPSSNQTLEFTNTLLGNTNTNNNTNINNINNITNSYTLNTIQNSLNLDDDNDNNSDNNHESNSASKNILTPELINTSNFPNNNENIKNFNLNDNPIIQDSQTMVTTNSFQKKLKNLDLSSENYQIIFPRKTSNTNVPKSNASPKINAQQPKTPIISIEEANNNNNNDNNNNSDNDKSNNTSNINTSNINRNNLGNLSPIISNPSLELPKPSIIESFANSDTLIPFVEYQKHNSIIFKIIPVHIYAAADTLFDKFLFLIVSPFIVIFNLIVSVPIPIELEGDFYKYELSLSIKLFHFQIGFLPLLIVDFNINLIILILSICLPILSYLSNKYLNKYYLIIYPSLSAIIGFLTVLKLITYSASGIILFLKDIADIYSLSESILGLTILSLGNSIGDVVTNLALAGLGKPLTGLHACFGSPLLYILFGIGICSLIVEISTNEIIKFKVDESLKLTSLSIILILLMYSITLPLNNWMFKRWMGIIGVLLWFTVTMINFILHRYK